MQSNSTTENRALTGKEILKIILSNPTLANNPSLEQLKQADGNIEINQIQNWLEDAIDAINFEKAVIQNDIEQLERRQQEIQQEIAELEKKEIVEGEFLEEGEDLPRLKTDLKGITKKLNDAESFVTRIKSSDITQDNRDKLQDDLNVLRTLESNIKKYFSSSEHIWNQYDKAVGELQRITEQGVADVTKNRYKQQVDSQKKSYLELFKFTRDSENRFNDKYIELISYTPTEGIYLEHAHADAKDKLEQAEIEKAIEKNPMANSQESVDRIKVLMYADEYYRRAKNGEELNLPNFFKLQNKDLYDPKTGRVSADKYPEFFKELTGLDVSLFDLENEIKQKAMRNEISKRYIDKLSKKEKKALAKQLETDEEQEDDNKRTLKDYLSLKDQEEEEESKKSVRGRFKRKAGIAIAGVDLFTDAYLNPEIQERAKAMNSAFSKVSSGNVFAGIVDLTRLPEINPRPSVTDELKGAISNLGIRMGDGLLRKIDETAIGSKIKVKSTQTIVRVSQKHKKLKQKKGNKSLFGFLLRWILQKTVGAATDVVKSAYNSVKQTRALQRVISSVSSSRVGQGIQSFATTTYKGAKDFIQTGKEIKEGITTKAGNIYKAVDGKILSPIVKPAFRIVRDVGYIGSTSVKKIPRSLVYGGAAGIIALTTGAPIVPVILGATIAGNVVETLHHIMHNPTLGQRSFLVDRLQKLGSAQFRNPYSGVLDQEIFNNRPELRSLLNKTGNIYGGRFVRAFSAAKTGLTIGLIGGAIAGLLGVNPLIGVSIGFVGGTAGHYAWQAFRGSRIAQQMLSGVYRPTLYSRLARLPATRIVMHVSNAKITHELFQEFLETLREGRRLDLFLKDNFSFDDKNWLEKFQIIQNYLGLTGYYFSTLPLYSRFVASQLIRAGLPKTSFLSAPAGGLSEALGTQGFISGLKALLTRAGFATFLKVAVAPTLVVAAGTGLGLAIAALLGVNIGGIGATVGAIAGSIVGAGLGAAIVGSVVTTGGLAIIPIAIVGAATALFTGLGAWVGSLFDKAADGAIQGLFAIVGGISTFFLLIDLFMNGLNFRNMVMIALSLALVLPAFSGIANKGSQSQSQADPTLERDDPATTYLIEEIPSRYGINFINQTSYPVSVETSVELARKISTSTYAEGREINLIITNNQSSEIYYNDEYLIFSISITESEPERRVDELLSEMNREIQLKSVSLNY